MDRLRFKSLPLDNLETKRLRIFHSAENYMRFGI